MARSQASNLSGMLGSIGDTLGKMGDTGNGYVDTFRRTMAPDVDMNDAGSLIGYADWARRNGYDDEAKQYLALGYKRKAVEEEKSYKSGVAQGTEKLRGFDSSIAALEEAAAGGDPNAQTALNKVVGARTLHIDGMNKAGSDSDFGTGNEGRQAEKLILTEATAAEKAMLEKQNLIADIKLKAQEVQDNIAEGNPIPAEAIPPASRKIYQSALEKAQNSDSPVSAVAQLNKSFFPASQEYLKSLSSGDPATKQALWTSVTTIRKEYGGKDSEVAEWINNPANAQIISSAIEQAEAQLLKDSNYRKAGKEEQASMAEEALIKILKGQQSDFNEIIDEYRDDLLDESAKNTQRSQIETRDRVLGYKPGFEQGGEQYKSFLAKAKASLGNEFSQTEFDESWEDKYWSPNGNMTPSSPTLKTMNRGPY
jgi:hypothetical protein